MLNDCYNFGAFYKSPLKHVQAVCNAVYMSPYDHSASVLHCPKAECDMQKGQKRPNVAVLVGNPADVAGGVRKGLVRSASYGGGRRIPKHLPKPSPSKRGHYWRKFRVTCCWHLPYSRLCSVNGWRTSPVAWAAVSSAAPLLWG